MNGSTEWMDERLDGWIDRMDEQVGWIFGWMYGCCIFIVLMVYRNYLVGCL